jgi:hypothetical protein
MAYFNRIKELQMRGFAPGMHYRTGGRFRLKLYNQDDRLVQDTGWFDNLLTDFGVLQLGNTSQTWYSRVHIGDDATAPSVSDTALYGWLGQGSSNSFQGIDSYTPATSPNYEFAAVATWRLEPGEGTGTVREVGLSYSNTNTNMCVRALVSPAIVKAADQYLDVQYEFKVWPDLVDTTGTTNFTTPVGSESFDWIARGRELDDNNNNLNPFNKPLPYLSTTGVGVYSGEIGSITGSPTGVLTGSVSSYAKTAGGDGTVAYCDAEYFCDLDKFSGTIRSFAMLDYYGGLSNSHGFQYRIGRTSDDTGLVKDNTMVLYWKVRTSWSRR